MKGLVDTSIILRAALNKEFGLRTNNRISHVSVIEVSTHPKLIFMSDGAMNIKPTLDEKRQIIENSIVIANALGLEAPKVGIIAAVEKVNPQMEATLDAVELIKMNKENILNGCIVGGPFAIDNAINKEAAILKGVSDPIAGDVDILIMPQIESGNVFYKSMMFLGKAQSASVIAGAKKPIVLTSRADSTLNKFHSIALGALVVDL
jgi:phosphate butyryltransferase